MARNNSERTYSSSRSITSNSNFCEDSFANLPDLSSLKEHEKRHILNVLGRDEMLRSKHLSRFMSLRKEVNELEQRPQATSESVCARCQTPFTFLFNTGAPCPKCGAKVCKQCRLIYNVNDNGWLCQLCCKQMQLMSYSGEWLYSLRSNLRKDSLSASEIIRKSLSYSMSIPNLNEISSSDTETEDVIGASNIRDSSSSLDQPNHKSSNNKINRMIIPTVTDAEKLNNIKKTVATRPASVKMPQDIHELTASSVITDGSSNDFDSLFHQSKIYSDRISASSIPQNINGNHRQRGSSTPRSIASVSTASNQISRIDNYERSRQNVDCASVTSSEWGADSEIGESTIQRKDSLKKYGSKQSLSSRIKINGSIQSLRDVIHRIPKPNISSSRTSLNSEKKPTSEISDTTTLKMEAEQNKSTSEKPEPTESESVLKSKSNITLNESTNIIVPDEPAQRLPSISNSIQSATNAFQYNNDDDRNNDNSKETAVQKYNSVGNLDAIASDDDEDDIDGSFEKAKVSLPSRAASCMDMRGSQTSINSITSDRKARYGIDVSGTIQLTLTYLRKTGALDIIVHKCTNLAPAKRNKKSDPYVKLYLLPDRSKNSKRKTVIKSNDLNPEYNQKFRYHLNTEEFETRVVWISVWNRGTLGGNDFLGELYIPLRDFTFDRTEEYELLAQKNKNDLRRLAEPTVEEREIRFQLKFIENPNNKNMGTLQVHYIKAQGIYHGKRTVELVCKGILMPGHVKRKIPAVRKGPAPEWEIPLRWEGVRRDHLEKTSLEISINCQENFHNFNLAFVRLNLATGYFDGKQVPWSDARKEEKSAWESFLKDPTKPHSFRLHLRKGVNPTRKIY